MDTKNPFSGVKVLAHYRTSNRYNQSSEIMDFIDTSTGQVVLSIGTDYSDDYYPSFVANFNPAAMSINADK